MPTKSQLHIKRLGEKLDAANATIVEQAARINSLTEDLAALTSADADRHNAILAKLDGVVQAFSFHMNANTSAINTMNAEIANLKVGRV